MQEPNMQEIVKEAVAIATAQASVRIMNDSEIGTMIEALASTIKSLADANVSAEEDVPVAVGKRRIKRVTCHECGRTFKSLSGKHLASHGITAKEYRARHGEKPSYSPRKTLSH